jgi:hypothetical protein
MPNHAAAGYRCERCNNNLTPTEQHLCAPCNDAQKEVAMLLPAYIEKFASLAAIVQERALEAALQDGRYGVLVIQDELSLTAGAHTGVPYGEIHHATPSVEPKVDGEWVRGIRHKVTLTINTRRDK